MTRTIFARRDGEAMTVEIYQGDLSAWFRKVTDNGALKADTYRIVVIEAALDPRSAVSAMIGKEWLPAYDATMARYESQMIAEESR